MYVVYIILALRSVAGQSPWSLECQIPPLALQAEGASWILPSVLEYSNVPDPDLGLPHASNPLQSRDG